MTNSTESEAKPSRLTIQPVLRLDNLLLVLPILGAVLAGIWEGGRIQQTLDDGIKSEAQARELEIKAGNEARELQTKAQAEQMQMLADKLRDVGQDVRELRSYMMTPLAKEPRR